MGPTRKATSKAQEHREASQLAKAVSSAVAAMLSRLSTGHHQPRQGNPIAMWEQWGNNKKPSRHKSG
uniref:Uncharacterized protein n=1 Tax=Oryza sativa subsp. japonica TaxID=39947 RepID=Q6K9M6_ORYSJ|nr:hypothetical protein [Oryza sativa Japonica Group]BAD19171.1 hypothetical protein [Oryza sativa Japonica Group]